MKKIFCMLIVLIISVSCFGCALSENSQILFRNIPWNVSVSEAISMMQSEFGDQITYRVSKHEDMNTFDRYLDRIKFGAPYIKLTFTIPDLKVAGYNVKSFGTYIEDSVWGWSTKVSYGQNDNVLLYFLPEISEDGQSYSMDEGTLYQAVYAGFEPLPDQSMLAMANEIASKLIDLYGGVYTVERSYSRKISNTSVLLTFEWGKQYTKGIGTSEISIAPYLVYRNEDAVNTMKELWAIRRRNTEEARKQKEMQEKEDSEKRGSDGL